MGNGDITADVSEEMNRFTIHLFKKNIRERGLDVMQLEGTWAEASDILQGHFGRISRIMLKNSSKLLTLYRIAISEMQSGET